MNKLESTQTKPEAGQTLAPTACYDAWREKASKRISHLVGLQDELAWKLRDVRTEKEELQWMMVQQQLRSTNSMNYWQTCIEEAVSEIGLSATDQQIKDLAEWVEGAHDNYGMAHGHDCIPNPLRLENERLAKAVVAEREKVHCKECGGTGTITSYGPLHSATSQCWKCRGEGRHAR